MTITGTGFANVASYVEVKFTDNTLCEVISSTPTQIQCEVQGFDKSTLNTSVDMNFFITITAPEVGTGTRRRNLQKSIIIPSGFPMTISSLNPAVISVSPSTLSPVLKGELVFTLQDYVSTMQISDFSVLMVKVDDPTVFRLLNVKSVDDSSKTLTV